MPQPAANLPEPTREPVRPDPPRRRYKLTIAYDGTLFHGWQKQEPPGREPLRTVAGVVEGILRETTQQPVKLVGASRTDAGVHARGQVAHFDAATRIPLERIPAAINSRLPDDVCVLSAEGVPDAFDAISDVTSKQYRYRVWHAVERPLDRRNYVYHCWTPLELAPMRDAAARLVGTHDFGGLAAAADDRESTVRTIHHCRVEAEERFAPEVHVVVAGSGFLYNMVRIIAGTLVEVGRGRFASNVIDRVLETRDRRLAGPTLPPTGLWLEWIQYREGPGSRAQVPADHAEGAPSLSAGPGARGPGPYPAP